VAQVFFALVAGSAVLICGAGNWQSETFNVLVTSEARRAAALFDVVINFTLGVHATSRSQVARIKALALEALFCGNALFAGLTGRSAGVSVAVGVGGTVGGLSTGNWFWCATQS
jgi:hypothetical protein